MDVRLHLAASSWNLCSLLASLPRKSEKRLVRPSFAVNSEHRYCAGSGIRITHRYRWLQLWTGGGFVDGVSQRESSLEKVQGRQSRDDGGDGRLPGQHEDPADAGDGEPARSHGVGRPS